MPKPRSAPSLREAAGQLWRLVLLIRPYWTPLIRGVIMALLVGLLGMAAPLFTKLLIDRAYPAGDVSLVHVLVAGMLSFSLASAVLGGVRSFFTLYFDTRLTNATRLMFFNHLQHLRARFFSRHQVGEINSRFQDVGRALKMLSDAFQTVFVQGVYLLLVPPVLFWLEWRLALLALVSVPLITASTTLAGKLARPLWKRTSEAFAAINAFQVETLSHIETLKSMALERGIYGRARRLIERAMDHQLAAGGWSQLFATANTVIKALNTALFTWFGWTLILGGDMTLGDYIAFTSYVGYLYSPLSQLVGLFAQFQQSSVHLSRMFEYLDSPAEQDPTHVYRPAAPPAMRCHGHYRLQAVSFGYRPGRLALADLELEIPAGAMTVVMGPSGSGKTTLLRLLCALETPSAGEIVLDGVPLAEIALGDIRRQIAAVWQDPGLVQGTLWRNLALGSPREPSRERIERAVDLCGLRPVVDDLEAGYRTPVAEWGASLSAGQRQRVALARALVRDAPILLLDEPTSHLDLATEAEVLGNLRRASRERTIVLVTHRPDNAELADRVCVLGNEDARSGGAR